MTEKGPRSLHDAILYDWIQSKLPKIELHAHLNGCIRPSTLVELANERNIDVSESLLSSLVSSSTSESIPNNICKNANDVKGTSDVSDEAINSSLLHCQSSNIETVRTLKDCFDIFAILPKVITDLHSLERITYEALEDFASHHVAYLELRSTPKRILQKHYLNDVEVSKMATKRDYITTVLNCIISYQRKEEDRYQTETLNCANDDNTNLPRLPLKCRFIVSIDRSNSLEDGLENLELAIEFLNSVEYKNLVVGIDLGGNPNNNDFRTFELLFQTGRQAGLKVTLHCAELPISERDHDSKTQTNERDKQLYDEGKAMLDFCPDRLGHALLLPPSLQKKLQELQIPVETCPTSNVMTTNNLLMTDVNSSTTTTMSTKTGTDMCKQHLSLLIQSVRYNHGALVGWLKLNHPLSICTDDPAIFGTTITQELYIVISAFSNMINIRDLAYTIVLKSLDFSFCDKCTLSEMQRQIKHRIDYEVSNLPEEWLTSYEPSSIFSM
jgi:adenosine deaminase